MDRFDVLLGTAALSAASVLTVMARRYGAANTVCFASLSGLFTAVMDLLSAYAVRAYVYPGQSKLWVFSFIFTGWMATCGSCLLLAEGMVLGRRRVIDVLEARWRVAHMTGIVALALDLFIDPVAVKLAVWVWTPPGNVYFGIPLYNFVGWHNLMTIAPAVWLLVVTQPGWSPMKRMLVSLAALPPTMVVSAVLSILVNSLILLTPWR